MNLRAALTTLLVLCVLAPVPMRAQEAGTTPTGSQKPSPQKPTAPKPSEPKPPVPQPPAPQPPEPAPPAPKPQDQAPTTEPPYPGGAIIESTPPDAIVLSLDDCVKQALESNLDIAVQRYNPKISDAQVLLAESVFDPTLSGSADITDNTQTSRNDFFGTTLSSKARSKDYLASWVDPLTTGGNYRVDVEATDSSGDTDFDAGGPLPPQLFSNYTTRWQLTYNQPLLRNLGRDANRYLIIVAQKSLGVSEAQFRQTVITSVTTAVKSYWDLDFAIMQLRTARFSLKLAQDFLEQNRIKVRVGTLAPIEITQAEAQVASREQDVITFEAALRAAEDQIRQVTGMRRESADWKRPVRPSEALSVTEVTVNEDEAIAAAMQNRPDVEGARLQVESWQAQVKARENQRRWGLSFQGIYGNRGFSQDTFVGGNIADYGSYSDALTDLRDQNQTNWSAGLFLAVPIGNRQALANFQSATANLDQNKVLQQQTEQLALLDVRGAVRNVDTTLKQVKAAEVNVRLQKEKLDAEQKKFENGMSTSFQVLSFQNDLLTAETQKNLAMDSYNKALVDLGRAKGTLLKERGILMQPEGGDGVPENPSAALRPLWRRGSDPWRDAMLRQTASEVEAVHLPAAFDYDSGRAAAARVARAALPAAADAGPAAPEGPGADAASLGGR